MPAHGRQVDGAVRRPGGRALDGQGRDQGLPVRDARARRGHRVRARGEPRNAHGPAAESRAERRARFRGDRGARRARERVDRERAVVPDRRPLARPALQVAGEDREGRKLGEVRSRRIEGQHGDALTAVVTCGQQRSPGAGHDRHEPARQLELPGCVAVDAQRAKIDAGDQVVARRRAAHRRRGQPAPDETAGEPRRVDQRDGRRRRQAIGRDEAVEHDEIAAERIAPAVGRARAQLQVDSGRGRQRLCERLGGCGIADQRDRDRRPACQRRSAPRTRRCRPGPARRVSSAPAAPRPPGGRSASRSSCREPAPPPVA